MSERLRWLMALLCCWALILCRAEAMAAVWGALSYWATGYVAAMLPFYMVLPALTSGYAAALYERVCGRVMAIFGLGGRYAGAVMISMMAGSPAGAMALMRLAPEGMTRGELSRVGVLCSGLSPLFIGAAIGTGALGSGWAGAVLMRAQVGAVLVGGILLRKAWEKDKTIVAGAGGAMPAVQATQALLTVGGYMAVSAVVAKVLGVIFGSRIEGLLLPILEVTGGAHVLAAMDMDMNLKMILIAGMLGFGGLSIGLQNLSKLGGLPRQRLCVGKLLHAALGALFCGLQMRLGERAIPAMAQIAERAAMSASLVFLLVWVGIAAILRHDSQGNQ